MFLSANRDLKCTTKTSKADNITYCGSRIKVKTNNSTVINPVQTYQDGSPSRYKTIMNIL
jgi:hypothetical protein